MVAGIFQDLRDGGFVRRERNVRVGALPQMFGIFSEHERGVRLQSRAGDGIICETDSFGGKFVEVRRLKFRLAVAAQVAVAESVNLDENDARAARNGLRRGIAENEGPVRTGVCGQPDQRGQQNERAEKTIEIDCVHVSFDSGEFGAFNAILFQFAFCPGPGAENPNDRGEGA